MIFRRTDSLVLHEPKANQTAYAATDDADSASKSSKTLLYDFLQTPLTPDSPIYIKLTRATCPNQFRRATLSLLDTRANQCPSPPSFIPMFNSGNTDKMNFPQRVKNMLVYGLETYLCTVLYASFDDLVSRYVEKDMSYQRLLGEGAIWLLRYDFVFEWPRPIMPNMVLIGGINCAKKAPLPADLQEFVEGSGDDGFIVFTMGSMVSDMPMEIATLFFEAFRQLPQRVLWRYEGKVPENAPKNVKLLKWLPQNDLLAHPKARVL
ncbi:hypothetical protein WMY93_003332 [Mugilogobius chulae]|uniref:UDP-glucuronosyltransferase n=1 Tax=Mugilogobius chulae TaxID=88201 RepID=A0AAW0Q216_9GOBI